MSLAGHPGRMTPEEYLGWEAGQETKHEYSWGEVTAMAGGSFAHGLASLSMGALLRAQKEPGCLVVSSDVRVRASEDQYFYPDVTLVCGDPEIVGPNPGSLTNPLMVVEVLSESTEARDRGAKFHAYRGIASLSAIVLVSLAHPLVEVYIRQNEEEWLYRAFVGLESEAVISLSSISLRLPLSQVYEGVGFAELEDQSTPSSSAP